MNQCLVNSQWDLREMCAIKRISHHQDIWGFFFLFQGADSLKLHGKVCAENTVNVFVQLPVHQVISAGRSADLGMETGCTVCY